MSIGKFFMAFFIFMAIVIVHEFGHFIVAKLCHIKVNEFSVGMGPLLLKWKRGETQYSFRLLPIGGYCAMEEETGEHSFKESPIGCRAAVMAAGAFMNLLLGFVIIAITTVLYGSVLTMQVSGFPKDPDTGKSTSSSEMSGLQLGDEILSVGGMHIFTDTDLSYQLQSSKTDTMDVVVRRDGEKLLLSKVTFHRNDDSGARADFYLREEKTNFLNVVRYSFLDSISIVRMVCHSFLDLITGEYGLKDLSGPIGIVSTIGDAASQGETFRENLISVLSLCSFITINVGIFNLLPIPALDGSKLVFLLIEAIRRKPVPPACEGAIHLTGAALLMLLVLVVTFQDVTRLL